MKGLILLSIAVCIAAMSGCALNRPYSEIEDLHYSGDGTTVAILTNLWSNLDDNFVRFLHGEVIAPDGDLIILTYHKCEVIKSTKDKLESIVCKNIIDEILSEFFFNKNGNVARYYIFNQGKTSIDTEASLEVHYYDNGFKSKKVINYDTIAKKIELFSENGSKIKEINYDRYSNKINSETAWNEHGRVLSRKTGGESEYEIRNGDGVLLERYSVRDDDGLTTKSRYHLSGKLSSKEYYFLDKFKYDHYGSKFTYLDGSFSSLGRSSYSDSRESAIFSLISEARDAGIPLIFSWDENNSLINNELYSFFMKAEITSEKSKKREDTKSKEIADRKIKARQEIYSINLNYSQEEVEHLYAMAGGYCTTTTVQAIGQPNVETQTCELNSRTYHFYYFVNNKMVRMAR